uniref:Uncharacterized protein n=1 Tax=Anguilla anguilla TaxID=7936 RepID=A0A0E9QFR3_ANGAN
MAEGKETSSGGELHGFPVPSGEIPKCFYFTLIPPEF